MGEFNLIDKPWIPCVDINGKNVEHGIRDMLLKAHELSEICDDSPLVTVAIHRLLLAILYRAFQGPRDMKQWKELYRGRSFNKDEIEKYLKKWRASFNLFSEERPFYQTGQVGNQQTSFGEPSGDGVCKREQCHAIRP